MKQLGELQERIEELESLKVPLTIVCLTNLGKGDEATRDLRRLTGFEGPAMIDIQKDVKRSLDVIIGSVVLIDPQGIVRWRKPGAKYKRARADLVVHAFRATVERDRDPEAVSRAIDRLSSTSPRKRARAATRLGELEALEAIPALEAALLEDKNGDVRVAAARALGALRDPDVLTALALAVGDEKREVRQAAGEVLISFDNDYEGYPARAFRHEYTHAMSTALQERMELLVPAAEMLLADRKVEPRRLGARLLFRIKHPSLKARYIELSRDPDADVRYAAVGGLFELRADPEAVAAARERLKDDSEAVRKMAKVTVEGPVGKVRE